MLWLATTAALVLAAGCSSSSPGDPSISAKADRSSGGSLQGLKVQGQGFTPNGFVLVTALLAGSGPDVSPYVEETVQADADGKFTYERKPLHCPQPADYGKGSWTSVVARDASSGISGSATLDPGREPDCTG
jgi:hypothetical protein